MPSRRWVMALFCMTSLHLGAATRNPALYRDVEFARAGDMRLALDAAIPSTGEPCPAVIVVHGGGWVRGDRRVDVEPLLQPLSDAGLAWFSISYRLSNDITQFGA